MRNPAWKVFNIQRVVFICLLLSGAAVFVHHFDTEVEISIKKPLESIPRQIGKWKGGSDLAMSDGASSMLGVDDYVLRDYKSPEGVHINFYASFFSAINRNKGFHSPLHCMPGSGWSVSATDNIRIDLPNRQEDAVVRMMLLKHGSEFQLSLYWYQCRSKIFASEYWELFYRVLDSFRYRRTDGAFIRLIAAGVEDQAVALKNLKIFAAKVIPLLENHLPEV